MSEPNEPATPEHLPVGAAAEPDAAPPPDASGGQGESDSNPTPPAEGPGDPLAGPTELVSSRRPSFVFFGVVAAVALLADVASKAWVEVYFNQRVAGSVFSLVEGNLQLILAYNPGGAWGLFHEADAAFRRPFFLIVSVAAIAFIVSLYNRLSVQQHALKWGLPLVLGGALGNLTDRIVRNEVIDFIDFRADWVSTVNQWVSQSSSDHWPTFNVADIAICVGVGLMAIDMLTSRRGNTNSLAQGKPTKAEQPASEAPREHLGLEPGAAGLKGEAKHASESATEPDTDAEHAPESAGLEPDAEVEHAAESAALEPGAAGSGAAHAGATAEPDAAGSEGEAESAPAKPETRGALASERLAPDPAEPTGANEPTTEAVERG